MKVAATSGPTRKDAATRWAYSMMALDSSGGNHCPEQRGQSSPQPSPDSVTLTTPPSTSMANTEIAAAQASPWNQPSVATLPDLNRPSTATAIASCQRHLSEGACHNSPLPPGEG